MHTELNNDVQLGFTYFSKIARFDILVESVSIHFPGSLLQTLKLMMRVFQLFLSLPQVRKREAAENQYQHCEKIFQRNIANVKKQATEMENKCQKMEDMYHQMRNEKDRKVVSHVVFLLRETTLYRLYLMI